MGKVTCRLEAVAVLRSGWRKGQEGSEDAMDQPLMTKAERRSGAATYRKKDVLCACRCVS